MPIYKFPFICLIWTLFVNSFFPNIIKNKVMFLIHVIYLFFLFILFCYIFIRYLFNFIIYLQEQNGSPYRRQNSHHERSGVWHQDHQDVRLGETLLSSGY